MSRIVCVCVCVCVSGMSRIFANVHRACTIPAAHNNTSILLIVSTKSRDAAHKSQAYRRVDYIDIQTFHSCQTQANDTVIPRRGAPSRIRHRTSLPWK